MTVKEREAVKLRCNKDTHNAITYSVIETDENAKEECVRVCERFSHEKYICMYSIHRHIC
jgi:hypothetical protein